MYKNNCKGGRKGEVKNPETSHGRRADGALFHHIRDNLGGIDALGTRWDFQQIANADKQTEDDWIDLYRSMGHTLYNLQQGVGHTIPQRCAAGVDLTGCKTIEDVAARRSEYETERKRKSDERKRLAAERKSKRQEADGTFDVLKMRMEIQKEDIIKCLFAWKRLTIEEQIAYDDDWDELEAWYVDYRSYTHLRDAKKLTQAVDWIETVVHRLSGALL